MKKIFIALALCLGLSSILPQEVMAAAKRTMLPTGYERLEWVNADGSRTIVHATSDGDVVQFIQVNSDNEVTYMWP